MRVRENGSSQSNAYSFPAVDGPELEIVSDKNESSFFSPEEDFLPGRKSGSWYPEIDIPGPRKTISALPEASFAAGGKTLPPLNLQRSINESLLKLANEKQIGSLPPTPLASGPQGKRHVPTRLKRGRSRLDLWTVVLQTIEAQMTTSSVDLTTEYETHFKGSIQLRVEGERLVIGARNCCDTELGIRKYQQRISKIFVDLIGFAPEICVIPY